MTDDHAVKGRIWRRDGTSRPVRPSNKSTQPAVPIIRKSIPVSEIAQQRELGWPDIHPEDYCHRCGQQNTGWYAPSPLWNAVMGYPNDADTWHGIICMTCFAEIAEAKGIVKMWRLSFATSGDPARDHGWGLTAELPTHSTDGRRFDWDTDLWIGQ